MDPGRPSLPYSRAEVMVAEAAREIADGEVVFVGMRLPLIAFVVAKRTHAPNAVGLFELGVMRDAPSPELLYTMGDPPNVRGATWCARTVDLMGLLQQGAVDAGFIGGAEVDRRGNLNTTAIGPDRERPAVQLPGSGGGADIASLAKRLIVIMAHEK
ncbi:MAG: CoA-transferase, partial [Acidobacteria bacterium]